MTTADLSSHQLGAAAHLEILVEEVEEEQYGQQGGQRKGGNNPNEDDGRGQLQKGTQKESAKVRQVLVSIHGVLSQPVDDAAQRRRVEECHWCPALPSSSVSRSTHESLYMHCK